MSRKTRVSPADRVKEAIMNLTGRDNRSPFQGGTQFPTEGSKSKSNQLGQAAKNKAEVGPAPLMGSLDKTKMHTLQNAAVKMPSARGSLPKIGSAMRFQDDPLVQYVQKHAEELKTNIDQMDLGEGATELQSEPSDFSNSQAARKKKDDDELLKKLFSNYPSESAG